MCKIYKTLRIEHMTQTLFQNQDEIIEMGLFAFKGFKNAFHMCLFD